MADEEFGSHIHPLVKQTCELITSRALPTEPGEYTDWEDRLWRLNEDGTWTDDQGVTKPAEFNWILATALPLTKVETTKPQESPERIRMRFTVELVSGEWFELKRVDSSTYTDIIEMDGEGIDPAQARLRELAQGLVGRYRAGEFR